MAKMLTYTIPGNPLSITRVKGYEARRVWDDAKLIRFKYKQSLKNQHTYQQIIDEPIKLVAIFYIRTTEKHPHHDIHLQQPSIFNLFNFLDQNLTGVVYKKDCIITDVELKKIYDSNPRTEIKIIRLQ